MLLDWVNRDEVDTGVRDGITSEDRDRIKALERENKELRRANEILKLASAFLPRWSSTANSSLERIRGLTSRHLRGRANLQGIADCPVRVPSANTQQAVGYEFLCEGLTHGAAKTMRPCMPPSYTRTLLKPPRAGMVEWRAKRYPCCSNS